MRFSVTSRATRASFQISAETIRDPATRVATTFLQKHQVFARTLVIRFALRHVQHSVCPSIALTSLAIAPSCLSSIS